jgi:hypothetical protein
MHGRNRPAAQSKRRLISPSIAAAFFIFILALPSHAASPDAARHEHGGTAYVSPKGAGQRDGSSWANAGTLSAFGALLARAGPGGQILLRADMGAYELPAAIDVRGGGIPDHPITVMGVDASENPTKAVIVGTRTTPYSATGAPGSEVFRLLRGANHLRFKYLSFRNQGNGCFRIGGDIRDLAIEHVDAVNVRRFIENTAIGSLKSASVDGLIIRDVKINGFSKGAVRLQYDTRNVLFEDVHGDSERQDRDNFAEGIALEGTVHDVVLRRVSMRNSQDTLHEYWNGDGFATERNVYRIRFEDTEAAGNTDAGYDLKSSETTLDRAVAKDNKHNFKLWGNRIVVSNCIGESPRLRGGTGVQSQFEILQGTDVLVRGCRLVDTDPGTTVFHLGPDAHAQVTGTTISKDKDAAKSLIEEGGSLRIE